MRGYCSVVQPLVNNYLSLESLSSEGIEGDSVEIIWPIRPKTRDVQDVSRPLGIGRSEMLCNLKRKDALLSYPSAFSPLSIPGVMGRPSRTHFSRSLSEKNQYLATRRARGRRIKGGLHHVGPSLPARPPGHRSEVLPPSTLQSTETSKFCLPCIHCHSARAHPNWREQSWGLFLLNTVTVCYQTKLLADKIRIICPIVRNRNNAYFVN